MAYSLEQLTYMAGSDGYANPQAAAAYFQQYGSWPSKGYTGQAPAAAPPAAGGAPNTGIYEPNNRAPTGAELMQMRTAIENIAASETAKGFPTSMEEATKIFSGQMPAKSDGRWMVDPATGLPGNIKDKPGLDWKTLEESTRSAKAREQQARDELSLAKGQAVGQVDGQNTLESIKYANDIISNPQNAALAEMINSGYALGPQPGETVADYLNRSLKGPNAGQPGSGTTQPPAGSAPVTTQPTVPNAPGGGIWDALKNPPPKAAALPMGSISKAYLNPNGQYEFDTGEGRISIDKNTGAQLAAGNTTGGTFATGKNQYDRAGAAQAISDLNKRVSSLTPQAAAAFAAFDANKKINGGSVPLPGYAGGGMFDPNSDPNSPFAQAMREDVARRPDATQGLTLDAARRFAAFDAARNAPAPASAPAPAGPSAFTPKGYIPKEVSANPAFNAYGGKDVAYGYNDYLYNWRQKNGTQPGDSDMALRAYSDTLNRIRWLSDQKKKFGNELMAEPEKLTSPDKSAQTWRADVYDNLINDLELPITREQFLSGDYSTLSADDQTKVSNLIDAAFSPTTDKELATQLTDMPPSWVRNAAAANPVYFGRSFSEQDAHNQPANAPAGKSKSKSSGTSNGKKPTGGDAINAAILNAVKKGGVAKKIGKFPLFHSGPFKAEGGPVDTTGAVLDGQPHYIVDATGNPKAMITEDGKPEAVVGRKGGVEVIPLDPVRRAAYEMKKAAMGQSNPMAGVGPLPKLAGGGFLGQGNSSRTAPSRRPGAAAGNSRRNMSGNRAALPDGTSAKRSAPVGDNRVGNGQNQGRSQNPYQSRARALGMNPSDKDALGIRPPVANANIQKKTVTLPTTISALPNFFNNGSANVKTQPVYRAPVSGDVSAPPPPVIGQPISNQPTGIVPIGSTPTAGTAYVPTAGVPTSPSTDTINPVAEPVTTQPVSLTPVPGPAVKQLAYGGFTGTGSDLNTTGWDAAWGNRDMSAYKDDTAGRWAWLAAGRPTMAPKAAPGWHPTTPAPQASPGGGQGVFVGSGGPRTIGNNVVGARFGFDKNAPSAIAGQNARIAIPGNPGVGVLAAHKIAPGTLAKMTPMQRQMFQSQIAASGQDPETYFSQAAYAEPGSTNTGRTFI